MRQIAAVQGLERCSGAFLARLCAVGDRLGIDPAHLAAVIAVETARTFRADIRNPRSGFVGLIQFGPAAARRVRARMGQLGHQTNVEQLRWVEAFFRPYAGKLHTVGDCYLAVFAPIGIGKPLDFVLYRAPSAEYRQNHEMDASGDGTITVGEAIAPALSLWVQATKRTPLDVPRDWQATIGISAFAALAAVGYFVARK